MATLIAAIGSNVRLVTSSPTLSITEYKLSTTALGKKVTNTSAAIFLALCPSNLEIM